MRRLLPIFVAVFVAAVLPLCASGAPQRKPAAPPAPTPATERGWLTDHARALKMAKDENKPLLISFTGSDWCPYCKLLDKEVFSTPRFRAYAAKNLVLLQVDLPRLRPLPEAIQKERDALVAKYGVEEWPTIIVQNPKGRPVGMLGYMEGGPNPWIAELERITGKR